MFGKGGKNSHQTMLDLIFSRGEPFEVDPALANQKDPAVKVWFTDKSGDWEYILVSSKSPSREDQIADHLAFLNENRSGDDLYWEDSREDA